MTFALDPGPLDLLFRRARTPSSFADEPVPDEQIRAVYELIKYGPTSLNMQPLRLVLVRSAEARERLIATLADGNKAKTAAAPLTVIVAADMNFHEHFHKTFPHVADLKDWFAEEGSRANIAVFNGALQLGYFIVGLRAAGLAAGPMTGFDAQALNKEFFGDGQHTALAVVNIGRPGEPPPHERNPRLEFVEIATTI